MVPPGCVDYRRLNRKLVKDHFPLPLIEDVLDKLQEAKVYTTELMRNSVVIIYMDDLIIPAKDEKEGLEKLREVLEVASKYGLEMKFKKCQFLRRKVEFLGHVVENETIRPSIAETIAVKKFSGINDS
ncbi:transposon Tf2-6 polyprotein [Trichonephila clavipes]|uniref:Transposon Tf2-6 polyprotein n=1 Tax=Trichonephila clavipes TaxID=2585209 RepID=A0A8X6RSK8_TRICX|nr:transposon Tf2-6 polyprotein [Trichonephila clavipes]